MGAFTSRERAESLSAALAHEGEPATVSEIEVGGVTYYRVRLGIYPDRGTAQRSAVRLAGRGYRTVIVPR